MIFSILMSSNVHSDMLVADDIRKSSNETKKRKKTNVKRKVLFTFNCLGDPHHFHFYHRFPLLFDSLQNSHLLIQ